MTLTKLAPRESAVDACTRALRTAILSGELAVGARLPPERVLAGTFAVNRLTLRSALAQLEASRLLSVRQGSGYTVLDWRRAGPDLLPALVEAARSGARKTALVADLLAVRRLLADGLLRELAARADADAVLGVQRAVEAFAALARTTAEPALLAAADLEVSRALVDATGSTVLVLCMNPLAAVLSGLPDVQRAMYAEPSLNVGGYERLLARLLGDRKAFAAATLAELEAIDTLTLARLAGAEPPARPRVAAPTPPRPSRRTAKTSKKE